ncbi:MAG: hypothetical protein HOF35_12300 [Bacteroidetes bacterium]|nr:hypothetical protein [Bacteroidota bacterium]MBT4727749.1 hypothetical protein [Bacteroidota bacterium]MBT5527812.1 hypothetical protein [Cytophagia bacterium]
MEWYQWFAIAALILCSLGLILHFAKILKLGNPKDFSTPAGNPVDGIKYSMTGAMSPKKKESAFLHLPTYTAGLIYHMGTFLSLGLFVLVLFGVNIRGVFSMIIPILLVITCLCGLGILVKRMFSKNLKAFTNADDYIANFLVSSFHIITAYMIYTNSLHNVYFMLAGLLLLYIPISKLKHTLFFFAARYHLGFFYGRRNIWPPKKASN